MAVNIKEDSIRRYLLGQLTEDKQREIEQRVLVEDDLFEELEATEAQLVDDYVAGRLIGEEREQFDQHFLTTSRRQQDLQFARVFSRYVSSHPVQKGQGSNSSWSLFGSSSGAGLRVAAGLVVVAIIGFALWSAIRRTSSPEGLTSIVLTVSFPNRADSAIVPRIPLPPTALKTVLRLPAGATPETNYRATLISSEDGTSRIIEVAERDAETVSLVIPAAQLRRGSYVIKLRTTSSEGADQPLNGVFVFDIE